MHDRYSPALERCLQRAEQVARIRSAADIATAHLLLALADEAECRGAVILASHGWTSVELREQLGLPVNDQAGNELPADTRPTPLSLLARAALEAARRQALELARDSQIGTEHLLWGILEADSDLSGVLARRGLSREALEAERIPRVAAEAAPLSLEGPNLSLTASTEELAVERILDASANRAREGLRVLEDYVRFAWDDPFLTRQIKALRHQLTALLSELPSRTLLRSRETQADVGTQLTTPAEQRRHSAADVVAANFHRVQEAVRSLEEYGKLRSPRLAAGLKQARYKLYTLQRAVMLSAESRDRLAGVRLYAIVTGELCQASLEWTVRELLAGGVQALQLREKSLPDRSLLDRARLVRRWTREAGAMFIMNDRADLARLADADGLHVGQSELSVKDARRIVGPSAVIGVSTHAIEQARQAVLDAAGYIGVGPLFAGPTKTFQALAGLDCLREVVGEIALPAFAIGGINLENVDSVLSAGARRIAVCSALCGAEDPREAARRFRDKVDSAN